MDDKKFEEMGARGVHPEIYCKNCKFANGEPPFGDGYKKSSCIKYPYPQTKPLSIYFDGAECEHFERG